SSRRRHTRCYRDWSSDVCSSDLTSKQSCVPFSLGVAEPCPIAMLNRLRRSRLGPTCRTRSGPRPVGGSSARARSSSRCPASRTRSEERRVGNDGSVEGGGGEVDG